MKIDLPITVLFDCQDADARSVERCAGRAVWTIRYDTDGDGRDAILFDHYPPEESADPQYQESARPILAYLPAKMDRKINMRAVGNPYDYLAGTFSEDERLLAQAKADAEKEVDA